VAVVGFAGEAVLNFATLPGRLFLFCIGAVAITDDGGMTAREWRWNVASVDRIESIETDHVGPGGDGWMMRDGSSTATTTTTTTTTGPSEVSDILYLQRRTFLGQGQGRGGEGINDELLSVEAFLFWVGANHSQKTMRGLCNTRQFQSRPAKVRAPGFVPRGTASERRHGFSGDGRGPWSCPRPFKESRRDKQRTASTILSQCPRIPPKKPPGTDGR
jgi:hypothetical protein